MRKKCKSGLVCYRLGGVMSDSMRLGDLGNKWDQNDLKVWVRIGCVWWEGYGILTMKL